MDASVFWGGLYAMRDLWMHDKPGFTWGLGLGVLLFWVTLLLTGKAAVLGFLSTAIGVTGALLFAIGLSAWIIRTPQRRAEMQRPDR